MLRIPFFPFPGGHGFWRLLALGASKRLGPQRLVKLRVLLFFTGRFSGIKCRLNGLVASGGQGYRAIGYLKI